MEGWVVLFCLSLIGGTFLLWGVIDERRIGRARRIRQRAERPKPIEVTKRSIREQAFREWDGEFTRLVWLHFEPYVPSKQELESGEWETYEVRTVSGEVCIREYYHVGGEPPKLVPRYPRGRSVT